MNVWTSIPKGHYCLGRQEAHCKVWIIFKVSYTGWTFHTNCRKKKKCPFFEARCHKIFKSQSILQIILLLREMDTVPGKQFLSKLFFGFFHPTSLRILSATGLKGKKFTFIGQTLSFPMGLCTLYIKVNRKLSPS